jgi:hypothetical protein
MIRKRISPPPYFFVLVSISSHDLRRTRQSDSAKYVKPTAPIDFSAYKKKLKFTGAAVDLLEV